MTNFNRQKLVPNMGRRGIVQQQQAQQPRAGVSVAAINSVNQPPPPAGPPVGVGVPPPVGGPVPLVPPPFFVNGYGVRHGRDGREGPCGPAGPPGRVRDVGISVDVKSNQQITGSTSILLQNVPNYLSGGTTLAGNSIQLGCAGKYNVNFSIFVTNNSGVPVFLDFGAQGAAEGIPEHIASSTLASGDSATYNGSFNIRTYNDRQDILFNVTTMPGNISSGLLIVSGTISAQLLADSFNGERNIQQR